MQQWCAASWKKMLPVLLGLYVVVHFLLQPQGDQGNMGEQGPQGSQGSQGPAGSKGEQGNDGLSGDDVSVIAQK